MTRLPAAGAATIPVVAATDVAAVRWRTERGALGRQLRVPEDSRLQDTEDGSGRIPKISINERFDCNVNLIFVKKMVLSQDILLGKLGDIAKISVRDAT